MTPALKVLFFGTGAFGLPALDRLVADGHEIIAVVTAVDKPQGRHLELQPSPVKEWAMHQGVDYWQFATLLDGAVRDKIRDAQADVFVVISYGKILPEELLRLPRLASLNVHSSLLPLYRGPAPIHWAILNGDAVTGVTVMRMAAALDTGPVLLQKKTPIGPHESQPALEKRLAVLGADVLAESLALAASGRAYFAPQDESLASYAPKIRKEDGRLDWSKPAEVLALEVRAFAGWPKSHAFLRGERILFLAAEAKASDAALKPGTVLSAAAESLDIACGDGLLSVQKIQAAGKNPLDARAFLQGCALKPGDRFE